MFEEKEKEWILESINHLKHRKARPDLSRISLRMKRKYLMSFAQTKKLLESLIESGIVVKAVYKNNTSYRDVSKWKKGRLGGQILNSSKMLKRFIRAIETIEESKKGTGVSAQDLEDYLASQGEEKCFLSGAALRDALENEISNGYLKKFWNGTVVHYSINKENAHNLLNLFEEDGCSHSTHNNDEYDDSISENSTEHLQSTTDTNLSTKIDLQLNDVLKAINETECKEGVGSSLLDIKEILIMKGINFSDDIILKQFLEKEVEIGTLRINLHDSNIFYAVNGKYIKGQGISKLIFSKEDFQISKSIITGAEQNDIFVETEAVLPSNDNTQIEKDSTHSYSTSLDTQQIVPLRPPSKRKRIMKDHGPDFEIEMPTKAKSKITTEIKESSYPTPADSPASEKSDTSFYPSFNFDKKKRGRPRKGTSPPVINSSSTNHSEENSKHGIHLETSSVTAEDNDSMMSSTTYPEISCWSAEQVASYFFSKGYTEESQSMLENELDGKALGLLRRSDIVGPPIGGLLQVKKLGVALKLFRDIRDLLYQGNADNYTDPYEERPFFRS